MIRLDRLYNSYIEQGKPESIKQKIDDLKKLIDNRSLTYYERMKKKNNNPFAIVEKNSCSGCHMNIPPVELRNIQERDSIHVCTYCGRFLIVI
ncbi:MAG TPA: C4-type zinc ribbon domain-containing protein [Spirochaetota bacterium]|nr:C4-type zinc ribbon domain-containing protein [Spirochaetota bacterium]